MAGYDDRDGFIWMDGKLVDWRAANVHILTHALHYASSVFEGERCYNGKIFKSVGTFRTPAQIGRIAGHAAALFGGRDRGRQGGHAEGQQPDRRLCARHRLARRGRRYGCRLARKTRSAWRWPSGHGATITATPR